MQFCKGSERELSKFPLSNFMYFHVFMYNNVYMTQLYILYSMAECLNGYEKYGKLHENDQKIDFVI